MPYKHHPTVELSRSKDSSLYLEMSTEGKRVNIAQTHQMFFIHISFVDYTNLSLVLHLFYTTVIYWDEIWNSGRAKEFNK